jgi:hypothetical protein
MLDQITGEHFRQLLGTSKALYLSDGSQIPVTIVSVVDKPNARMSATGRMPFGVELRSPAQTSFIDGPCAIELPELGLIEGIVVSRTPELGRDAGHVYFDITVN